MFIIRTRNVQIPPTDVIDSLIVDKESAVCVFNGAVCRQNRVVWFYNGSAHPGSRVHGEFELGLFGKVRRETLKKKRAEPRASAATEGVEDHETLKTGAAVGHAADTVNHVFQQFFPNGVVPSSIYVPLGISIFSAKFS